MKKAEANIYLDRLRPKQNGLCSVKIRVTFKGKRKYFPTGIDLTEKDFDKIMSAERRTSTQKEVYNKLNAFYNKAVTVIDSIKVFTFDSFIEYYLEERNVYNSVSFAFDKYINELKQENRIGTATSYECAKNSLQEFKKDLSFAETTPTLLKKYERWMLDNDRSVTTVGIYTRSLRAVFNNQNIDKSLYPFGEGKNKYSIPISKNVKKALTIEEVSKIYNYEAPKGSTKEMAKDYWMFLYLCNGMNVKDFCLLKWSNIDEKILTYTRAKTKRNKKENKPITVALKPETFDIIKKWGVKSLNIDAYVFPCLKPELSAEQQQKTYKQLTKIINKYVKKIADEVGINKKVTTYYARHSFATVLKRSGASVGMISELLGHSSVEVTESYLDSFENEQIQKQTDALTIGFKKAY